MLLDGSCAKALGIGLEVSVFSFVRVYRCVDFGETLTIFKSSSQSAHQLAHLGEKPFTILRSHIPGFERIWIGRLVPEELLLGFAPPQ